jgi:4-amino-4-deoxy-L-arabinose transferase-like glycosyltransferase
MADPTAAPDTRSLLSRAVRDPRVVAAAVAVLVRGAAALQAVPRGVSAPVLDGAYYLDWAADVAGGDLLGRGGTIHGEPFLFNPLYAYAVAPLVGAFGKSAAAVVAFQAALAGATATLAASAARRLAGAAAAWTAGLATALSAVLVHLDLKVAVSGLAAFLVAGTCHACAPAEREGERGHGPFAAGLWLGLSALARPVTLFALPFVAWLYVRRGPRKFRAALLVIVPFGACAALSLARNLAVAGEAVVYTAANGQNLHLGNNPAARRVGAMATDEFTFGPLTMHKEARYRVAYETGRRPTSSEISAWFTRRAVEDFRAAPGESVAWCWTKLRWFASPDELSSSYAFAGDRDAAPLTKIAFVPTWLLVAAAAAALVASRRRTDLLLGPGALAFAHVASCTLAFPLSHYRSPAVPALAVAAAVAAVDVVAAWRARRRAAAFVAGAAAALVAVVGAAPPQSRSYPPSALFADQALAPLDRGDLAAADELARRAIEIEPDEMLALTIRLNVASRQGRHEDARALAARLAARRPWNPNYRIDVAIADARLGRGEEALRGADEVVAMFPWDGDVRGWRGAIRVVLNDAPGAIPDLTFALDHGGSPPSWALDAAGLRPK